MAQQHPHVTTMAGRKFYGEIITLPTGVQTATASNSAELQSAVNNPANVIVYVDGSCESSTVEILAAHSNATQRRYIVSKDGGSLAKIVMFRAFNWCFTCDGVTTEWVNFGSAKGSLTYNGQTYSAGTVFGAITCIDTDDVIVDRWRFRGVGGFLSYHNTDGHVVRKLVIQRGNYRHVGAAVESVVISRPAWNGEMVGGSGVSTNGPYWDVRSIDCKIVNNKGANPGDFYQPTGNGIIQGSPPNPAWMHGVQTGAGSLSDEGLIIAGNDVWVDEYIYNEDGLPIRSKSSENFVDLKNGSNDPNNPLKIFDNRTWGWAPGRGWANSSVHLSDPGQGIVIHHETSRNVEVYDNIIAATNRGFGLEKGYYGNCRVEHNLFYNGPGTHGAADLPRFLTDPGSNSASFGILWQHHTGGGDQLLNYNHIMHYRVAFSQNFGLGDPPPTCVGNVALGGGTWIGPLDGMSPVNCISDKNGFGAKVSADVLARSATLTMEVPDPNNMDDPHATVLLVLPQALIDPADAPTSENRWVIGNEAEAGEGFDTLALNSKTINTPDSTITHTLSASGGTEPYTYELRGWDDPHATVTLIGDTLTVTRGDDYSNVTVDLRATDAAFSTNSAQVVVNFRKPQVPDIVWQANNTPNPDKPASSVADGDLGIDGGWTGSTAGGPSILTGLWPVPHDIDVFQFLEALDSTRSYTREWRYTTDGTTWLAIPGIPTESALKSEEGTWNTYEPALENVLGIQRYATGNSDQTQFQRVTEIEIYGTESIAVFNPPVCIAFETTAQPGETLVFDVEQLAALDTENGGNLLAFTGAGHSISPAGAGTLSLVDGELQLQIPADFSGDITLTHTTESAEI